MDITSCGNFAIIGLSSGTVDVYNMQSGIHRGSFGNDQGIEFFFLFAKKTNINRYNANNCHWHLLNSWAPAILQKL